MANKYARVIWFVLVGWWLGPLWVISALLIMLTVVGFPLGVYMLLKTWEVMTLKANPKTVVVEAKAEAN
jgi:uncharacterized membrane protein YccF (DUF307 family)